MATIAATRSVAATLSGTTVDVARLEQCWDLIAVTNLDGTDTLYITDDGATDPVAAAEETMVVPAGQTRTFPARQIGFGVPDGTNFFHEIRVLGDGGAYVVEGLRA